MHLFELTAILDGDGAARLATVATLGLNLLHNIPSLEDLSENDVTAIEPSGLDGGNELVMVDIHSSQS